MTRAMKIRPQRGRGTAPSRWRGADNGCGSSFASATRRGAPFALPRESFDPLPREGSGPLPHGGRISL